MVTKRFLYFTGDAFSWELLELIKTIPNLELFPVQNSLNVALEAITGVIYTPSLNFKEKILLESLPSKIKRIAILDLFHFDFKDYLLSFKKFPPDLVFTPCEIDCVVKEIIIIPSFIKSIYSALKNEDCTNKQDICFISQPLLEERKLDFNQHDIIARLHSILKSSNLKIKIFVKPHPREDISLHKDYFIFKDRPEDALKTFYHFAGFNSALLYAAEGLGKNILKFSTPEQVTEDTLLKLLKKKPEPIQTSTPSALHLLTEKLHYLN